MRRSAAPGTTICWVGRQHFKGDGGRAHAAQRYPAYTIATSSSVAASDSPLRGVKKARAMRRVGTMFRPSRHPVVAEKSSIACGPCPTPMSEARPGSSSQGHHRSFAASGPVLAMVELRVVAEDALFIERNSPFTAKIGGHPGQRCYAIVQLADPGCACQRALY